jgi:hypothetical protein
VPSSSTSTIANAGRELPDRRAVVPCSRTQGNPVEGDRRPGVFRSATRRDPLEPGGFPAFFLRIKELNPRDGFAADFPHRQPVCGRRDFALATGDHPRKPRAFAGSWGRGTAESEPETASSGPISGSCSRLSLLPSSAVPIRLRFASVAGGARADETSGASVAVPLEARYEASIPRGSGSRPRRRAS